MGFHIQIDDNTQRLLQKLRTSPIEIFEEGYAGYLLFLFGGADESLLSWFSRHVVALDSLTGAHVAFAIFAKQVPIKVRTHERKGRMRQIGPVELESVHNEVKINRLLKSGEFGQVYSGDEIIAMTYAADEMARAFGVIKELPCLLVLDGLPRKEVHVIHLDEHTVDDLIPTLRQVMHRLIEHHSLARYLSLLKQVADLLRNRDRHTQRLGRLVTDAEKVSDGDEANERLKKIELLRKLLPEGEVKAFVQEISILQTTFGSAFDGMANAAKQDAPALAHCLKTSRNLRHYLERFSWPLAEPYRSRYQGSYREHVRALIPGLPEYPNVESPTECQDLILKLDNYRQTLADKVFQLMPNEADYLRLAKEYRRSRVEALGAEIKACRLDLGSIEGALATAVKECISDEHPSLSRMFTEVLKGKHLKAKTHAIVDSAKAFAGQVSKPETLLKVWGLIHGA